MTEVSHNEGPIPVLCGTGKTGPQIVARLGARGDRSWTQAADR